MHMLLPESEQYVKKRKKEMVTTHVQSIELIVIAATRERRSSCAAVRHGIWRPSIQLVHEGASSYY